MSGLALVSSSDLSFDLGLGLASSSGLGFDLGLGLGLRLGLGPHQKREAVSAVEQQCHVPSACHGEELTPGDGQPAGRVVSSVQCAMSSEQ